MAIMIGWQELILILAVLVFLAIVYQVYWVGKRKLAAGITILILASAWCLLTGLGSFAALWSYVQIIEMPLEGSQYVQVAASVAFGVFFGGLGTYGMFISIKAFRVMGTRVLDYKVPNS